MKIAILLFSLLISLSIHAQDYEIVRFEASDFRDFTSSEVRDLLGLNSYLIPLLECNGQDEFDPFMRPIRNNPRGDSLRVQLYKSENYYVYKQGRYFTQAGTEVTALNDVFVKHVVKALSRLEKIKPTAKLLRMMEESYFPLTIEFGGNSFKPTPEGERPWSGIKMAQAAAFLSTLRMTPGGPFSDIGVGGFVSWHPTGVIKTIESDGVTRVLDNIVGLAHEMYHAFDSIRGKLDLGSIRGVNYAFTQISEYRAVYFENLVRKELGIKYRKFYSEPSSLDDPDVLDDNGEPIYIPSTCL